MDLKKTCIGIELGSTRIKAVLLDSDFTVMAQGGYSWENSLLDGVWTYSLEDAENGLRECFRSLKEDFESRYGMHLTTTGTMGISGMMHGYLALDENDNQICEFRTWRNTITEEAAYELSEAFDFNVPQRWSVAHLYQAVLKKEKHLERLKRITTLSGYIHYKLTGEFIVGICEASGMFPIDSENLCYNRKMADEFNRLVEEKGYSFKLDEVFPEIRVAGEEAGHLTREGALFLDPTGEFEPGVPLCPCEGDAGTGMVATNSVRTWSGNVSAGTSDFAMVVLEGNVRRHREIDMVTTPAGKSTAMVHCNNCTCDIDAWINVFGEAFESFGFHVERNELFNKLYRMALEGDADAGGMISYNYYSGEGVTDFNEGRIVQLRHANSIFNLKNLMRNNLMSAMATLAIGMDILKEENIEPDILYAHGGFFKTPDAGQSILSAAVGCPVCVMESAGEGGPYGMALLAMYMLNKKNGQSLEDYLENEVFSKCKSKTIKATDDEISGFRNYIAKYKKALVVEREAVDNYS